MAGTSSGINGQVPQAPIGLKGKGGLATPQRRYYPASEQGFNDAFQRDFEASQAEKRRASIEQRHGNFGPQPLDPNRPRITPMPYAPRGGSGGSLQRPVPSQMDGYAGSDATRATRMPMPAPTRGGEIGGGMSSDPRISGIGNGLHYGQPMPDGSMPPPAMYSNQPSVETTRGPMPFPPQGGPAYPMPRQQPTGFNINTAAAKGLQDAMATTTAETGYKPMQVNPAMVGQRGYNPSIMAGVDAITADNVTGTGYDASTIGDVRTVSADNVQAGQLAGSDLSAYTNPYETQVVDQALGDIERNRLMAQNVGSAQAGAANAFGGSRQGIAEAETNRAYIDQAAKTASGLRQAGYMNAQEQSGQDIGRRMQASLANQQANMQAGQFNANTDLSRQQANQGAFNQAGQFGASAFNQGNLANQSANMQAQQASASNALAAQQANQAARNNAGQFGANAFNQAGQLNQSAMMQARLANQNAGLSGSQQRLNAGQQLGNLSNLGFGMGQQIQGRMDQQGAAQQNLQQQIINAAKGQYGGFTGAPNQSLQALLAAVGGAPAVGSQTKGYTPGLFDYLSLGAGMK